MLLPIMAQRDESAARRRNSILNIVQHSPEKKITLRELTMQLSVSTPTLRSDIAYLRHDQQPIEIRRGVVSYNPAPPSAFVERLDEDVEKKQQIAEVAHAVVYDLRVRNRIKDLFGSKTGWRDLLVTRLLDGLFHKSDKIVSLDAGTTTLEIAKKFAPAIPSAPALTDPMSHPRFDRLSHLTVLTNAYDIINVLNKHNTNERVQTVMVGGEVREQRHSVVGHLAERCLDAFDIVTDICFCGATGFDPERGFTSDSIMEARMKTRLLDLSKIRCIALTSNKVKRPGGTYSVFAGISRGQLDCVVMDDGILTDEKGSTEFKNFRDWLATSGITLLTPEKVGLREKPISHGKGKDQLSGNSETEGKAISEAAKDPKTGKRS